VIGPIRTSDTSALAIRPRRGIPAKYTRAPAARSSAASMNEANHTERIAESWITLPTAGIEESRPWLLPPIANSKPIPAINKNNQPKVIHANRRTSAQRACRSPIAASLFKISCST